ncbi:MAG: 16S rRNA (cytosine(1402)-N(4))-methyltransferase RsmH [Chlorobium sp.]|nr:MAG: 16S rRNA (cytosine(1402)-N(4))-methyltransferase RsmH [Chlorobium sp.]
MAQSIFHDPVLATEVVAFMARKPGIYIDGTLGGGGHSKALLHALHQGGYLQQSLLVGIDQDDEALQEASKKLKDYEAHTVLVKGNFQNIEAILKKISAERALKPKAAGILLDLGVSSFQIDTPSRGFSYLRDGPLDMRMNSDAPLSAADIVNNYEEKELARLFYRYGEEPRSRSIARAIVARRDDTGGVCTTLELASIIRNNAYGGEKVIKTLSRVFQALRIEVNGELDVLRRVLDEGIESLDEGGRMAVISYHSLEDRIVKTSFAEKAKSDWGPKGVGLREPLSYGAVIQVKRKPVTATAKEIETNPRARSAKLRIVEKISR